MGICDIHLSTQMESAPLLRMVLACMPWFFTFAFPQKRYGVLNNTFFTQIFN